MAYLGTQPNDVKKNIGIYTPSEILKLTKDGSWGGSLIKITEASFSSSSLIAVTTCEEQRFDLHYFKFNFGQGSTHDVTAFMDFSTDGGSSYEGANLEYGMQYGQTNNSFSGSTSTGLYGLLIAQSFNSYDRNYYVNGYIYNMGNSSKSTSVSVLGFGSRSGSETYRYMYGGGQSGSSNAHNAFKVFPNTGNLTGSYELFGVKKI